MAVPASANASRTMVIVRHTSCAVRKRACDEAFGAIARNAGAVASGSTMTNTELRESKIYSDKLTDKLVPVVGLEPTRLFTVPGF